MLDLIKLGLERMDASRDEITNILEREDWDELARVIHKLRPVLHFVGLVSLEDDLVAIEKNAKARTGLENIKNKLPEIFTVFDSAETELGEFKKTLGG